MSGKIRNIVSGAVISAIYVVFSILFKFSVFGIEIRISEALMVLPAYSFSAVPALFAGCIVTNIFGGNILDIVFGSCATLIGAIGTYKLRKFKLLKYLPPILANTVILPFVIKFGYGIDINFGLIALFIFIGEAIPVLGLGFLFEKYVIKKL